MRGTKFVLTLSLALAALATIGALKPVAAQEPTADNETAPVLDLGDIPPEIAELATDPTATPQTPWLNRKKTTSPRSSLFYALPVIGFWLILRRRSRGVRL